MGGLEDLNLSMFRINITSALVVVIIIMGYVIYSLHKQSSLKSTIISQLHSSIEDQVNLTQAREYSRELGSVGIRATREKDGVKDNYLHTHEQISSLFDAWYGYKTKILNAFSEFKIELKNADTRKEIEKSFSSFEKKIKEQ